MSEIKTYLQILACAIVAVLATITTTRRVIVRRSKKSHCITNTTGTVDAIGRGPDSTIPLHFGKLHPISWLRHFILLVRRNWSLPQQIVFLPAPPSSSSSSTRRPTVLFLLFPGTFKDPKDYVDLCKSIQRHALSQGIDVHVGIAKFFLNVPFLLGVKEFADASDAIRARAATMSLTYNAVYVAGHSIGGAAAMIEAVSYEYDGLILLSCTCNSAGRMKHYGRSLSSYPLPVLTLMGTRDGFLPYLALADELDDVQRKIDQQMMSLQGRDIAAQITEERQAILLEKPIVALKGVNHMQLADGIVPNQTLKTGRLDLNTDLSVEDAWELAGKFVSDFVFGQVTSTQPSRLLNAVIQTVSILEMYREMSKPSAVTQFLESIQRKILNLEEATSDIQISSHWHDMMEDFIYSRPSQTPDGKVTIEIVPQEPIHFDKKMQQLSPTYAVKLKSQEAVLGHRFSREKNVKARGPPLSLAELNSQTFHNVLENYVTAEQRNMYEKAGQKVCFLPDLHCDRLEWVDAPLQFVAMGEKGKKANEQIIGIRSPVIVTLLDFRPSNCAGMWCGKPLMPAQAYEWIVFGAFKGLQ